MMMMIIMVVVGSIICTLFPLCSLIDAYFKGSEMVRKSNATGQQLEEAKMINKVNICGMEWVDAANM